MRGAGGVAVALPWLEVMEQPREARAASIGARRFVCCAIQNLETSHPREPEKAA
jgi:hypothetical protein